MVIVSDECRNEYISDVLIWWLNILEDQRTETITRVYFSGLF
jgi:hypothetical protein